MKKVTKFNFRTLLVLFLSIALCLSTALSVACDKGNTSSSSSSSTETEEEVYPTDTQKLLNGDFEYSTFTKEAEDFPVASSISWVRSSDSITTSAVSSSYTSGIIDTEEEAYTTIASKAGFHKLADSEEYFNPHTPYDYEFVAEEDSYVYSEEVENEDGLTMTGTKILMIHNEVKGSDGKGNGEGTAQKFTSSTSLSLARNEYAKISVWVLTHDLVSAYAETDDFGAYIAVQNTVSSSVAPFVIKNINTNSQWAKYSIYLSSSDFATSSFKVVLGLGFGSKDIRREYVEGFAYFDNVHYEVITKAEYEQGIQSVNGTYNLYDKNADDLYELKENEEMIVSEKEVAYASNVAETGDKYTERSFVLSHTRENQTLTGIDYANGTTTHNQTLVAGQKEGTVATANLTDALSAVNAYLGEGNEISAPVENSNLTALYFLHSTPTTTSYETAQWSLEEGSYLKLNFWVKVGTKYPNDNALTVTLNDVGTGESEAVKTVIASNVNTNKYEDNENYNNWIEYAVFVSNTLDADANVAETRKFTLKFDFGTTALGVTESYSLTQGYAIITTPTGYYISEKDYSIADTSSYTYAKKVAISADRPNGVETEKENDDSYAFTHGANDNNVIKEQVASNVIGYTGVVGNSTFVGGTEDTQYSSDSVVAGLVNSQYTYADADINNALANLGAIGENEYVQPLMIKTTSTTSYGYVGANSTLSAESTTVISVKVKVVGDAEAYIYITNSDALERFVVLGIDAEGQKVENNELVADEVGNVKKDFIIKVTADDMKEEYLEDGWLKVTFLITTGNQSIAYRTELWNGERNGEAKTGIVLFDNYSSSTAADTKQFINQLKLDYPNDTSTVTEFTRVPTKVTYTNEDGEDAVRYITYEKETVVEEFAGSKTVIINLSTIHAENEIDKTEADDEEDTTTDTTDSSSDETSSFSWALQLTSIIIAVVLIALLLVVLGRMLYKNIMKKKGSSKDYYNRDSREKAGLAIEAKNARKAKQAKEENNDIVEGAEEVVPYDYDNMDNNLTEETTEEGETETAEETAESAGEATEETETTEGTSDTEEKPE